MLKIDAPKKPVCDDWNPAYIVYRLRLNGLSLRRLSRQRGYSPSAASVAIHIPWPKMERLIADAIGVKAPEIWPSRYDDDGAPKAGLHRRQHSTGAAARNVHMKATA